MLTSMYEKTNCHTCFLTDDNSASYYSKAQTVQLTVFSFLLETTSNKYLLTESGLYRKTLDPDHVIMTEWSIQENLRPRPCHND